MKTSLRVRLKPDAVPTLLLPLNSSEIVINKVPGPADNTEITNSSREDGLRYAYSKVVSRYYILHHTTFC